ncbi:MAG: GTP-binding protein LepA [Flavobacteriaceae bacterium]|nr:GTP-binding protein LepA [Flavobacteriaceae bacterium]|tara:strand:- start:121060 stop:121335 length:276 start_codon:yes stop_codon:yes gene_type:complete
MAWSRKKIVENIEDLMRSKFTHPKDAFDYYDQNKDGELDKDDFKRLLKEAKVSPIIRGLVAEFMIQTFDANEDGTVNWDEFQTAIGETDLK